MTYAKRISFQDQEYLKNLRAHELARQHGKARANTELNECDQKFKKKIFLKFKKFKARAGKNLGSARLMARLGLARLMKQSNPNIRIFLIFFKYSWSWKEMRLAYVIYDCFFTCFFFTKKFGKYFVLFKTF